MWTPNGITASPDRNPPPLPKLELSEELVDSVAKDLRVTLNKGLKLAHDVALGRDYVLFFKVRRIRT